MALEYEMNAFVTKPIDESALFRTLVDVLAPSCARIRCERQRVDASLIGLPKRAIIRRIPIDGLLR